LNRPWGGNDEGGPAIERMTSKIIRNATLVPIYHTYARGCIDGRLRNMAKKNSRKAALHTGRAGREHDLSPVRCGKPRDFRLMHNSRGDENPSEGKNSKYSSQAKGAGAIPSSSARRGNGAAKPRAGTLVSRATHFTTAGCNRMSPLRTRFSNAVCVYTSVYGSCSVVPVHLSVTVWLLLAAVRLLILLGLRVLLRHRIGLGRLS